MYAFLLSSEISDGLILISMLFIAIIIAVPVGIFLKSRIENKKTSNFTKNTNIKASIKSPFLPARLYKFFVRLRRVLPREYIVFPRVAVDSIIDAHGSSIIQDKLQGQYVDFCIFRGEDMAPIVVVDLIDPQISLIPVTKQSEIITRVLDEAKLPTIEFNNSKEYEDQDILSSFLSVLDPLDLENLRRNRTD